ncbi:PREDICTED: Golgi integral membrane protein 4-like [Polistes dominula]|uniref:Golgi integral membrane protein 4-like n=1 Tax=Polistes dominula TaxID=743375 RepID=A0ABM1IAG0_POLDO|nr:PREDICTED: Golgi integral membrane protein 4-like [Polistes dominula]
MNASISRQRHTSLLHNLFRVILREYWLLRINQMSGSRLGRGRGGRLAVYGGCGVVIILLVFLYRAATSEMARLRELHIQCVHQHESLAAQLQVIFEYKVRLEKSLAEEKSSNAMAKQELQQRASREKSLRDKDSMEAMQRFKSLQQSYKILQTDHRDLEEECKKQEAHAYEEKNRLESMQESVIKRIVENKDKIISEKENTLERFKNKYFDLETEKETLEEKYKDLIKSTGNTDSTIEHLKKEVFQLRTQLEETKKQCKSTLAETSLVSPKESHQSNDQNLTGNAVIDPTQQEEQQQQQKHVHEQEQQEQQQQQQAQQQNMQVSRPNNDDEMNSEPLPAPRNHHAIGDALSNEKNMQDEQDDALPNQEQSNVRFAPENGNIIPVGPSEMKEDQQQKILPLPYDLRDKRLKKDKTFPSAADDNAEIDEIPKKDTNVVDGVQDSQKNVLAPPKMSSSKDPNELDNKIQDERSTNNGDTLIRPDSPNNFADFRDIDNEIDPWQQKEEVVISSSSMKTTISSSSSMKLETSTKLNNIDSVSSNKVMKTSSKVKIPPGVLPILMIMDQNVEKIDKEKKINNKKEGKKNDVTNIDNNDNIDSPYKILSAKKYDDDENVDGRRQNGNWFKVKPGVQEFGEEPNPIDRLAGLESIVGRQFDTGDEQYVGADFEAHAQKVDDLRLAEGEEEEDEDDPEDII